MNLPLGNRATRLLLIMAGLVAGLALCEVGLRVWTAFSPAAEARLPDPLDLLIEPYGEYGYRQKPGAVFVYPSTGARATANAGGYRGPLVSGSKPPGVLRIVLLGGSATHGWGVADSETIDVHMRAMLRDRFPTRRFDVVNLAFDANDSWQMFERLRADGLPLDPDVVIMNAGVNDVRNGRYPDLVDRDERTMIWEGALRKLRERGPDARPPLWWRLKHTVYLARVPSLVRRTLASRSGPEAPPPNPHPDALDYFERNVRRVTEASLAVDAAVVLSTPPSSLPLNFAPHETSYRDYWIRDAGTTQEYRDSLAGRMEHVQREYASRGRPVSYLRADVPPDGFLDDAHLTAEGNRILADALVTQVAEAIRVN